MDAKRFFSDLAAAFFPRRCAFCGRVTALEDGLCAQCRQSAARVEAPVCKKCGRNKKHCNCRGRQRYFTALAAPFYFEGVVRSGIHNFKFNDFKQNSEAFSRLMAHSASENYGEIRFDFVTSVPMTARDIKRRGYDQGALLAKGVAKELDLVYDNTALRKIYETKRQHTLKRFMRSGNLTGVFEVCAPDRVRGKTVLLCDDVSTSGETLDECAKMLYLAGASETYCLVLALTNNKAISKQL